MLEYNRNDNMVSGRKQILGTGLILLEKKSIIKLTVTEICKCSNISTRTFYNHFCDKYDMAQSIFLMLNRQFWRESPDMRNLKDYADAFGKFILAHKKFIKNNICYTGQNCLMGFMKEQVFQDYKTMICHKFSNEAFTPQVQVALRFYIHGSFDLMMDLIQGKMDAYPKNINYMEYYTPDILKGFSL